MSATKRSPRKGGGRKPVRRCDWRLARLTKKLCYRYVEYLGNVLELLPEELAVVPTAEGADFNPTTAAIVRMLPLLCTLNGVQACAVERCIFTTVIDGTLSRVTGSGAKPVALQVTVVTSDDRRAMIQGIMRALRSASPTMLRAIAGLAGRWVGADAIGETDGGGADACMTLIASHLEAMPIAKLRWFLCEVRTRIADASGDGEYDADGRDGPNDGYDGWLGDDEPTPRRER